MKKIFKGLVFSLLVGMSLAVQAVPAQAPVCNEAAIATYKQEIIKNERTNMLVRSAVYVCAASAMTYAGYKILTMFTPSDKAVLVDHATRLNTHAADIEAIKKKLELPVVTGVSGAAAVPQVPFLSKAWFKNLCLGVRDIVLQSTMAAGVYKVGEVLKDTLFYDKSIHGFVARSGYMKRALASLVSCVVELETSGFGEQQMPLIKEIFKQRCVELGSSIERSVAYMRYLGDYVNEKDRGALVLAEKLLIYRTNTTLTTLWSLTNKEKPEEFASGIMLTLHLFEVDFEQAYGCFENAYAAALAARA